MHQHRKDTIHEIWNRNRQGMNYIQRLQSLSINIEGLACSSGCCREETVRDYLFNVIESVRHVEGLSNNGLHCVPTDEKEERKFGHEMLIMRSLDLKLILRGIRNHEEKAFLKSWLEGRMTVFECRIQRCFR